MEDGHRFFKDRWSGETCFVLASGPSLTEADVNLVKGKGKTIVTNTTFRMAPWADALFFYDIKWYNAHRNELKDFCGYKVTVSAANGPDVIRLRKGFSGLGNSGAGAVSLAVLAGCKKIILLGVDCQHTNGERHWHGNHPRGLGNALSYPKWPKQFERAKNRADERGCIVLNATRTSALKCFDKVQLEDVI